MNDLFCFLDGFGGGGPLNESILIVSVPAGSTVTATLGPQIKTAQEKNGEAWLRNLDVGEWNLKLTLGEQSATATYNIPEFGVYRTSMAFFLSAADFVWGGEKGLDYEIVQDDDTVISVEDYGKYKNWNARILTSITVTSKKEAEIDVFGVGGGSSATKTTGSSLWRARGATPSTSYGVSIGEESYEIVIGAGGDGDAKPGGDTKAFGLTWNGDDSGFQTLADYNAGEFGFDGDTSSTIMYGGNMNDETPPPANTGKGSKKKKKENQMPPPGASGIVIFRIAREAT